MAKSIKLNFLNNIILNVSKVLFPLITAPYVSRVLEPDGVGLYNFASTYASYYALFAALGAGMYGIREIAKYRDSKDAQTRTVSELCSLLLMNTIFCSILFIVSLFIVPQLHNNYLIFILSGFYLYFTPFKIDWYYQGMEEFGYITFRSLIIKIISIIALFLFVKTKGDLYILVIINALSATINELWNFIKLYKSGIHPRFTMHFRQHLKPMLVLFASMIAISIYSTLDTLMLGFLTSYDEVGFYNNASHIAKAVLPVTTSLAAVVMPRLSYYTKTGEWDTINSLMKKSLSVVSFLCFPLTFAIIVLAPTFVPLFYGDLFYGTILPLQIVSGVIVAIGLNNLLGVQILIGLGKDKLFLYAVLLGSVSNFVLNTLLIPSLGAIGASAASVFAETLILLFEVYLVKKYTPVKLVVGSEMLYNILIPFVFIPVFYILSLITGGWLLVIAFTILGSLAYFSLQYLVRNSIMDDFVTVFKNKFIKK